MLYIYYRGGAESTQYTCPSEVSCGASSRRLAPAERAAATHQQSTHEEALDAPSCFPASPIFYYQTLLPRVSSSTQSAPRSNQALCVALLTQAHTHESPPAGR
jgi:hypothetical protein